MSTPATQPRRILEQISTCWPVIRDPVQFTLRYAPAIERYLRALIRNPDDAEDVLQNFLLRGLTQGFVRDTEIRGRFRDYLKSAVRHAALDHLARRRAAQQGDFDLTELPAPEGVTPDQEWLAQWRQCLLARVWEALHAHQKRSPGNLFHTVLQLTVQHPDEDCEALATRASAAADQPVSAAAFRKQRSRARDRFAELLVEEVGRTLQQPTAAHIEEELADLGLLRYVNDRVSIEGMDAPPSG